MINFDSLPTNKPTNLPESGTYYATISSAEMKQGRDVTKAPYLSIVLDLKNKEGKSCGKIYDNIAESDKELVQYKLARFIIALNLTQLGTFELVDLVKVIKNKQLIVDVKQEEAKDGYPAKAVVDVFTGSIYYPMSEASNIFGAPTQTKAATDITKEELPFDLDNNSDEDSLTIDASDAADVHIAEDEF